MRAIPAEMSRRSFLGVAFATAAGVPLVGRAVAIDPSSPHSVTRLRTAIRVAGGELLEGPPVEAIGHPSPYLTTFRFAFMRITTPITVAGYMILDQDGRVLADRRFAGPHEYWIFCAGQGVRITHQTKITHGRGCRIAETGTCTCPRDRFAIGGRYCDPDYARLILDN